MKKSLLCLFCLIAFSIFGNAQNDPLDLGNPSGATADQSQPNNFLVQHQMFVMSYNMQRGEPNWVAWHLTKSDIGTTARSDFIADELLPQQWQIRKADYNKSGYDRGHMCPSKDRSDTVEHNQECFVMSNMEPQTANLNRHTWKNLEDFTRKLVMSGNEVYVYAGCYGNNGSIKKKITIPTQCFKIIIVLPEGNDDLKRITDATRIIVVDMPNTAQINNNWKIYQKNTSIDKIEAATHFNFLSNLPKEIEIALKKRVSKE